MPKEDELILLIDKASAIAGSDYKLAQLLGVGRQTVSNWRHGHKPCPIEDQALMASIANIDPVAELARAAVRKHEGTRKGDLLMRALGKASRLTGAAASFVGAVALLISGMTVNRDALAAPTDQGDNVSNDESSPYNMGYVKSRHSLLQKLLNVIGGTWQCKPCAWGVCTPIPPAPSPADA